MPPKRPLSGESFVRPDAIGADAKRRASARERKRRSRQRMAEEKAMESFRERAGECHKLVCTLCGQLVAKSNTVKFTASSYVDVQGEVMPMDVFHKGRICTKCHRYARKHTAVPPVDVVSNIVEDSHQDEEDEKPAVRSDGSVGFRSRQSSVGSVVGGGERSHHPHHRSREGSADSLEDFQVVAVVVAGPS
ncbi:unnamed protein product [Allacma fusca]|uniref:Uncharacterized protein n=1 Tax=Allacma fusca TaxID=39272 RepID=A0A8J2JG52_9HEXA|nr:unnamed protein product [Allacma fusca]